MSVRAVLLGLVGVILICWLTPYNDYALNNTFLVGNNLPLGAVLLFFLLAVLINGPLSRFAPRWALSSGELTVAFAMTLVSCALPSSGLMRYFPGALIGPLNQAQNDGEWMRLLDSLGLPRWLYPSFAGKSPSQWANEPAVRQFYGQLPPDEPVPYALWVRPALTWGVLLMALYGALLCMVAMVRRQWMENERLPFPLAQIQLALVEAPRPGRFFNDVFRQKRFWIAFGLVFLLHSWNGVANYVENWPRIYAWYSLWDVFTERPWVFLDNKIKDAAVFFTVVGVTYFLTTSVAFSLWFFYILDQVRRIQLGMSTGDPWPHGREDEHFGALVAIAVMIAWVGRKHWMLILRQASRGVRPGEPRGRYLSYPAAFWGFIGCTAVMIGWLTLAGATLLGASVAVLLMLLGFLLITRIIAETGLVHGQVFVPYNKPWVLLSYCDQPHALPTKTFFLNATLYATHYDYREVVPVYASHALKVADQTVFGDPRADRRIGRRITAAMFLALAVGYVVSFASTLRTQYRHAYTLDEAGRRVNEWGAINNPRDRVVNPTLQYDRGHYTPRHKPLPHIGAGFGITALLGFLRLRFAWWPLHPIGFVMLGTFPSAHLWFSIFCGWLCKVGILRFGGATMYQRAKPFFIGLIVGESVAAGAWLISGVILSALGRPYVPLNIMPG